MTLRGKTIIGIATIEAALLLVLVLTAINFMSERVNEDLKRFASTTATLFATTTKDAVLSYDLASLDAFVSEVLKNPDIRYARVLGADGEVFSQGGEAAALQRTFQVDTSVDSATDGVFDAQAVIEEDSTPYGRVEIGVGISGLQESIQKIRDWTSTIALMEMLLVALFSYVLGTYLTSQLKSLRQAARQISSSIGSGRFEGVQVEVRGRDELSDVAVAFNKLVVNLEQENARRLEYEHKLEDWNRTLEARVRARTEDLANRNRELAATNSALQEAQEQLLQSEKMASLGQLAAGVAHEINTPIGFVKSNLSTLAGYADTYAELAQRLQLSLDANPGTHSESQAELAEFLRDQELDYLNEDTPELLRESIDGLDRVKDIVGGLRQFSRQDNDGMESCDINQSIETTLKMVGGELKQHCELVVELGELPEVQMNAGKITQVLTNLLVNAGHAIEGNGRITVTSERQRDRVAVRVADTGKGIEAEHLKRVFDPFFTTKPVGEGTGLGLSISYGILQEHGGGIEVQSKPGEGTSFTLWLPVDAAAGEPASADARAATG